MNLRNGQTVQIFVCEIPHARLAIVGLFQEYSTLLSKGDKVEMGITLTEVLYKLFHKWSGF